MQRYSATFMFALIGALLWSLSAWSQNQENIDGHWEGYIGIETTKLLITVELTHSDQGGWMGTISIPAQGTKDAALKKVTLTKDAISFVMPKVPGDPVFNGRLSESGKSITGEFSQSGRTFLFTLERRSAELSKGAYGPTPEKGLAGRSLEGNWQGMINAGGSTMRLVLKVSKGPEEGFTARLDSPDQSMLDLPVDVLTLKGRALAFDMKRIGASYSGTLDADASEIDGEWQQSGASLDVRFKRLGGQTGR